MPKSWKRAKLRPGHRRTSPETELMQALLAGVDSPTPGPLLGAVGLLLVEGDDPDVRVRDVPPADARARIAADLRKQRLGPSPFTSEAWTQSRPIVDWTRTTRTELVRPAPR